MHLHVTEFAVIETTIQLATEIEISLMDAHTGLNGYKLVGLIETKLNPCKFAVIKLSGTVTVTLTCSLSEKGVLIKDPFK